MPLCPTKWQPLIFFAKLHKIPLLMANIVKDTGRFLATEIPWKIMKNTFCFNLTNWIFYWKIRFWTSEFLLNQMSDIRENWKYWPLKDGFLSISQTFYRAAILCWVDKDVKLLADISFESSLQNTVLLSLLQFLCACY